MIKPPKPLKSSKPEGDIMAGPVSPQAEPEAARLPAGIVIGRYVSTDEDGRVWLRLPGAETSAVSAASCLCDATAMAPDCRVAVMFVEGRPDLPVVLGPVLAEVDRPAAQDAMPETIELAASKQVTLRCGKAVLRLMGDGSAVIRGEQVISRATRTNRIRGGNVQIN